MTRVPFVKVESVGNDFVLIEAADLEAAHIAPDAYPSLTLRVAPRRFGIGSDGLLVLDVRTSPLELLMFNPDGTPDFCGNGLRCASRFAVTHRGMHSPFVIRHLGRDVPVEVCGEDGTICTRLGAASFAPAEVPLSAEGELFDAPLEVDGETLIVSALSTGSTHTIVFCDTLPDDDAFFRLGPALEHHPLFPERTSAIWAMPQGDDELRIRIWERGAGETQGCGTGSSAAAVAWLRRQGRGGTVAVHNPGGTLHITLDRWDAPLTVRGMATVLFNGTLHV